MTFYTNMSLVPKSTELVQSLLKQNVKSQITQKPRTWSCSCEKSSCSSGKELPTLTAAVASLRRNCGEEEVCLPKCLAAGDVITPDKNIEERRGQAHALPNSDLEQIMKEID